MGSHKHLLRLAWNYDSTPHTLHLSLASS
jgi:hypothetical protein